MDAWYNNPIELSENNHSSTGVTVTIRYNAEKAITAGYLFVTFPANFGVGSAAPGTDDGQTMKVATDIASGINT